MAERDRRDGSDGAGRPDRGRGSGRPDRSDARKGSGRPAGGARGTGSRGAGVGRSGDRDRGAAGSRGEGAGTGGARDQRATGTRRPGPGSEGAGPRTGGSAERGAPRKPRRQEPPLPDDVTGRELDRAVRAELASLAALNADAVARHLVMAGRLLDDDPDTAYAHAAAAAARAGRVGAVREAAGLAAYRSGRYAEALSELRAARRITGDNSFLPVMADSERGLGRPERALEMAATQEAAQLDPASRVELAIVVSGARRDLGQPEAAVLALQAPAQRTRASRPWAARLYYAYADALLAIGRRDEAIGWFDRAADADAADETDADVRLAELSGVTFVDGDG